jgi:hypothetical protein
MGVGTSRSPPPLSPPAAQRAAGAAAPVRQDVLGEQQQHKQLWQQQQQSPPQQQQRGHGAGAAPVSPGARRRQLSASQRLGTSGASDTDGAARAGGTAYLSGASHVTSASANSGATRESAQSSSIADAFVAEATNMSCSSGLLRFRNGAIMKGIVCNRLDQAGAAERGLSLETLVATFVTRHGDVVQGVWVFQRLQYDIDKRSPACVYVVDVQVVTADSRTRRYSGPALVLLKRGELQLPLAPSLLVHPEVGEAEAPGEAPPAAAASAHSGEEDEAGDAVGLLRTVSDASSVGFGATAAERGTSTNSIASADSGSNSVSSRSSRKELSSEGRRLLLMSLHDGSNSSSVGGASSLSLISPSEHFSREVEYSRYPLESPRVPPPRPLLGAPPSAAAGKVGAAALSPTGWAMTRAYRSSDGALRGNTEQPSSSSSSSSRRVRRDHRMLFWSLCGKELPPSKWDEHIESDLRRTHLHRFLDRSQEAAREQLHSILRYVAVAFPAVGYCQGMHCVAKFFLAFSEPPTDMAGQGSPRRSEGGGCSPPRISGGGGSPGPPTSGAGTSGPPTSGAAASEDAPLSSSVMLESERAFVLFAQLLEDEQYRLSELFHPSFTFYRQVLSDIDREIARREPVLFAHLEACGLTAVIYAAKWILTLFTFYCDQDFASVTNVWLRFLSDGWDAVLRVAVAVVCCVKEHLLNADAEGCMLVLSGTTSVTPHGVLEVVFGTARGQALLREQRKWPPEPDGQVGLAQQQEQQQDQAQARPPRAPSTGAGTVSSTTGSNETWSAGRSATSQLTAPLAGATGSFNSDAVELDLGSVARGRRGDADGSSASDASSSNGGAASGDKTISAAAYLRSARVIRRTVPTRRYTTPTS